MQCEHNYQPVDGVRAVYRCTVCFSFAYKSKVRIGYGTNAELTPYKCYKTGCEERVVVLFPKVRGVKRNQPSCTEHRKDKQ